MQSLTYAQTWPNDKKAVSWEHAEKGFNGKSEARGKLGESGNMNTRAGCREGRSAAADPAGGADTPGYI